MAAANGSCGSIVPLLQDALYEIPRTLPQLQLKAGPE